MSHTPYSFPMLQMLQLLHSLSFPKFSKHFGCVVVAVSNTYSQLIQFQLAETTCSSDVVLA